MSKVKSYLLHIKFIRFIVDRSKRIVLPGFRGFSLYDVIKMFFKIVQNADLADRAGSISFYFLLAIPPTCIFLFTLLPYVPMDNLESTIYLFVRDITPTQKTYSIVHGIIHDFLNTQRTGLLSFSFLLAIYYSSSAVAGIIRAFDRDIPGFRKRKFIKLRWMALKLNCVLILLTVFAVMVMVVQSLLVSGILGQVNVGNSTIAIFIKIVRWIIILLVFFTMISLIYTYGPAVEKRWRFITPGSTLATALMIASTLGFSFYVENFGNYNQIYGSIGSIIILMIWILINSFVLLIGFELNASIEVLQREKQKKVTT